MPEIYFLRHGESQANADGILAGWQDSPLTVKGLQQANQEAALIRDRSIKLDAILSSPLRRAYDTATIIAGENNYPLDKIQVLDNLKEKYGGGYEGQPIASLAAASAEEVLGAGAESFIDFAARVQLANQEISRLAVGITLIVGHSGFYRMAQVVHQGRQPHEMVDTSRPSNGRLLIYPLDN